MDEANILLPCCKYAVDVARCHLSHVNRQSLGTICPSLGNTGGVHRGAAMPVYAFAGRILDETASILASLAASCRSGFWSIPSHNVEVFPDVLTFL